MKTFRLQILTPERAFWDDEVEMLRVTALDGEIGIAAGHMPMIIATKESEVRILKDGVWRVAAGSDGYVTVTPDSVLFLLQTCEWPEEIDENRAQQGKALALEKLRQQGSVREHYMAKAMLARAMVRLRVLKDPSRND